MISFTTKHSAFKMRSQLLLPSFLIKRTSIWLRNSTMISCIHPTVGAVGWASNEYVIPRNGWQGIPNSKFQQSGFFVAWRRELSGVFQMM
jgi:hypothetical protein